MEIRPFNAKAPICLDVVRGRDGGVDLVVVDMRGETIPNGRILSINNNGELILSNHLSSSIGLKLGGETHPGLTDSLGFISVIHPNHPLISH